MASKIEGSIYRVSVDSERNFIFVNAQNREDLIRFLAEEYDDPSRIYGAKEICKDGSLAVAPVVTDPLFKQLTEQKLRDKQERSACKNTRIDYGIRDGYGSIMGDSVVVEGTLKSREQLEIIFDALHRGKFFVPEEVGLPLARPEELEAALGGIDYDLIDPYKESWFELYPDSFRITSAAPTVPVKVEDLVEAFAARKGKWSIAVDYPAPKSPSLNSMIKSASVRSEASQTKASTDDLIRAALAQDKEQVDKSISPETQAKMDAHFKETLKKHFGIKNSDPER